MRGTMDKHAILNKFMAVADQLVNDEMQEWLNQGGKIIGTYCSYVPEEIIAAAGFMPFRIRAVGSDSTELSDVYLTHLNCSFVRHSLNMALKGEYDFLDGVVTTTCCDHARRLFDNFARKKTFPFIGMMSVPKRNTEFQVEWYYQELLKFKQALEKQFNLTIPDERIREAISIQNESRRLQKQLFMLRKEENPPISGSEALATSVAATAMPASKFNALLKAFLNDRPSACEGRDYRARLLILGGILDNPQYIKLIEDQGGLVVADSLCFGSRLFWEEVDETDENPLKAIARYHIVHRPSCPHLLDSREKHVEFIMDLVHRFQIDGIIMERINFCDNWGFERYMLRKTLKERGIPFLSMDREYLLGGTGQMKTRVQAFLETLEGDL
jgi:benzoyl-CoA reductase subunit C